MKSVICGLLSNVCDRKNILIEIEIKNKSLWKLKDKTEYGDYREDYK